MMTKPILLGIRRKETIDGGECGYERALREPGEIVIADDMDSYQLFGDTIFVAPRDSGLEGAHTCHFSRFCLKCDATGFYASLGCRPLSIVVQEEYKESKEIRDTEKSRTVRSLILRRLPLFTREYTYTQFQVPLSLPSTDNFKVKVCERLLVSKTLTIGKDQTTRDQDVGAVTKCDEGGQIELWLSDNAKPDMYE